MQRGARRRQVVLLGMGGSSLAPEVLPARWPTGERRRWGVRQRV